MRVSAISATRILDFICLSPRSSARESQNVTPLLHSGDFRQYGHDRKHLLGSILNDDPRGGICEYGIDYAMAEFNCAGETVPACERLLLFIASYSNGLSRSIAKPCAAETRTSQSLYDIRARAHGLPNEAALHIEEVVVEAFVPGRIGLRSMWTGLKNRRMLRTRAAASARDRTLRFAAAM